MFNKKEQQKVAEKKDSCLEEQWDQETDVIVIGYGGAGAAAALAAHDGGADVLILEKASSHLPGGNTGCCAGYMLIPSSVSEGIDYYRAMAFGTVEEEEMFVTMAKRIIEIPEWLKSLGASMVVDERRMVGTFSTLPGSRVDQIRVEGGGAAAFAVLAENVKIRSIPVLYETPGEHLITDPATGEVRGVMARRDNNPFYVKARRGVVLTCGGYQNNPEMLRNFNYPGLQFYHAGTPYNTGDGISMATSAGAKLWHMATFEIMNFALKKASDQLGSAASLPYQPMSGSYIFVNKYGHRFTAESTKMGHYKGDIEAAKFEHFQAEFPNIPPFIIFDEAFRKKGPLVPLQGLGFQTMTWVTVHELWKWSEDNLQEIDKGWIVKGNTISEVAEKLGIEVEGLVETVEHYNTACERKSDPDFERKPESMEPIKVGPFYGAELGLNIINTQGGPMRNAQAQILGWNNVPIPRLYGAGELGSFFGHLYQGGSNFPEALAFGRIAGANAAGENTW